MKINTNTLARIIEKLPPAKYAGEIHKAAYKSREDELNDSPESVLEWDKFVPSKTAYRILTFVSVCYAKGKYDQWFEWELET